MNEGGLGQKEGGVFSDKLDKGGRGESAGPEGAPGLSGLLEFIGAWGTVRSRGRRGLFHVAVYLGSIGYPPGSTGSVYAITPA